MKILRIGLALLASLALVGLPLSAQTPESQFHRAYFLERERGHFEEALALYQQVAQSREASAALQAQAKERAAALGEEIASVDLARLMPPTTIAYAELFQPGQALLRVLEQLGLTGSFEEAAAKGGFAIRPEMVRSLAGIRGLAVALTRLPVGGAAPGGVLVANAGDVEVLRGLIEAGVLAEGTPGEPIDGVPTWSIHSQVHVAVGRRLVIASDAREEIAAVLRRLKDKNEASLATRSSLRPQLEARGGAPFFLCLDAVPLRPLLQGLLAAQNNPQTALLGAALDVQSLRGCVARLAVGEDGLALEADLYLEENHKNLVFNLLRHAPLDPVLLERIPEGVAAFVAGSFNERGPAIAPLDQNSTGAPVVTALDFGRELFANLAGCALFVVPGGAPVPSAALVLTSNDPARTGAVLGLVLGLGSALASGQALEQKPKEIAGAPTRVFQVPPGIPLYLSTHENTLILSPSEELIESALEGRASGTSVLHDEVFAPELGRLGKSTTFAVCAHLGRLMAVAQPFLGGEQRTELARYQPIFAQTVMALETRHSGTQLGLVLALHGLPRIGGLLGEYLQEQRSHAEVAELAPEQSAKKEGLLVHFERLAAQPDDGTAARAFARQQLPLVADDAKALNNFAWSLLTEARFQQRFDDVALEYAKAANERSGNAVWQYLDTLALAQFRAGEVAKAVATEERALAQVDSAEDRADVESALARFRAAQGALAREASQPR